MAQRSGRVADVMPIMAIQWIQFATRTWGQMKMPVFGLKPATWVGVILVVGLMTIGSGCGVRSGLPDHGSDDKPRVSGVDVDADNTGVIDESKLTLIVGDHHVTEKGAIVENLEIRGSLYIDAADVTVRNVKITCSGSWWIVKAEQPNVRIIDSTLTVDRSRPENYCQYGISAGENAWIERNDISQTPNGMVFVGNSATVQRNFVHEQRAYPGKDDHVDAAQVNGGGAGPFVFRSNHFSVPESQTGCLALFADFGEIRDVLAEDNLFDGAGYSVYGGTDSATRVRFTGNWFGRTFFPNGGKFGPVTSFNPAGAGNEWSDNRWLDTGAVVKP